MEIHTSLVLSSSCTLPWIKQLSRQSLVLLLPHILTTATYSTWGCQSEQAYLTCPCVSLTLQAALVAGVPFKILVVTYKATFGFQLGYLRACLFLTLAAWLVWSGRIGMSHSSQLTSVISPTWGHFGRAWKRFISMSQDRKVETPVCAFFISYNCCMACLHIIVL